MRRAATAFILVVAFSVVLYAQSVYPPSNASSNNPQIITTWQSGATVNVYINTNSYPSGSSNWNAITAGFNTANSSYAMNVTFNFVGYSGNPPSPQGNYVYIYQDVPTGGGAGYTATSFTQVNSSLGYINAAAMQFNPGLSTPEALQSVVTHEVSHTFGLGDCPDCGNLSDSIMYYFPSLDFTTTYYPTNNDELSQLYYSSPE